MKSRLEAAQILALRLGRWRLCHRVFVAIYDLAGWLLSVRLKAMPCVDSVLLRGSRVSGSLVPGLSDLDFEVILSGTGQPNETVRAVREIHCRVRPLRRLFPWLQSPFIRSTEEWRQARRVPHEWLTHSRWRKLTGPLEMEPGHLDRRQHALAMFRLCLRELTKTIPAALFRTPRDGVRSTARFNPDRLEVLANLGRLLGVAVPNQGAWSALRAGLERDNYITGTARSSLALHLAYQYQALESMADSLLALDDGQPGRFQMSPQADDAFEENAPNPLLIGALAEGFEMLSSSGGCRYSQRKLYLLPPSGLAPRQLAKALESFVDAWQRHPPADSRFHLSYAAPIVLPRKLLALVHLGVGSCFEGFYLRQAGVLTDPVAFQAEVLSRELGDGVFLLRKKVGMMFGQPERFIRYLQDYFVGVYPGLALALRNGEIPTRPGQAAQRFCQNDQSGDYQRRLANYLEDDLYSRSRRAIEKDPFRHLELLEGFHRQLIAETSS